MQDVIRDVFCMVREGDPENLEKASHIWEELVQRSDILPDLVYLVETLDDAYFRNLATIMTKQVLEKSAPELSSKKTIIETILKCLFKEKSGSARNELLAIVGLLLDQETLEILLRFASDAVSSQNLDAVNAVNECFLMLETVPANESVIALIDLGMKANPPVSAIKLAFKEWNQLNIEMAGHIWTRAIEVALCCTEDATVLAEICHVLIVAIENHTHGDLSSIVLSFLPQIGGAEPDPECQFCFATVVSQILMEVCEPLQDEGFVCEVLSRYFALSLSVEEDLFTVLCHSLHAAGVPLKLLMAQIGTWMGTKSSRCNAVQFLAKCIESGYGMERDEFIEIVELIGHLVEDDCKRVREEVAGAIQELALACNDNVSFGELPLKMIRSLGFECTSEMGEALMCVLEKLDNVDTVFDDAVSTLLPLITTAEESCLYHILPCIIVMCESSDQSLGRHFEVIATTAQSILTSNESRFVFVKGLAIELLTTLLIKCPLMFSERFEGFIAMLCDNLLTDDSQLQDSVIKALSSIFRRQPESVQFPVDEILRRLFSIDTSRALSLVCVILDERPEFYMETIDTLVTSIEKLMQKSAGTAGKSFCRCIALFVDITSQRCELDVGLANNLLAWAVNTVTTTKDEGTCAEAIGIIVELITNNVKIDFTPTATIVDLFFNRQLPCLDLDEEYNDILFPIMGFFIKLLVKKMGGRACSFLHEFSSQILEGCGSANPSMRDFSAQLLGQFVESSATEIVDDDVLKIVNMAIEMATKWPSPASVFVLNQCACGAGNRIPVSQWTNIIHLLFSILADSPSSALSDHCVNAIGSIVQRISINLPKDAYLSSVMKFMPARSDMVENIEMMHFFLWIAKQYDCNPPDPFISVLIRLFATPKGDLKVLRSQSELWSSLLELSAKIFAPIESNLTHVAEQVLDHDPLKLATFIANTSPAHLRSTANV